ncbi:RDD family protein [Croceiramulus getboli]|nr:RDD family protein [Flavobacteriaceae bacterium YJPT1-3]
MDNFQIETAQNVSISQNVAGIGERILAFLIDGIIIFAYLLAVLFLMGASGLDNHVSEWVYQLVLGLPIFLYHLLFETFMNGRSPGKYAMNTQVVKLDGSKPGFGSYFVRWLMRVVDISFTSGGVAVLSILLSERGQRLGDIAAGTTVISTKKQVRLSQTLMVDIPESYVAKYPQVTVFKDDEIQTIKTVFMDARRYGKHDLILALSDKASTVMGVVPDEKPIDFVDRIIKDYNFYTQQ